MSPVLNPPVVQLLPTADLVVPEWNPRKHMEEAALQDLMAHLQAGNQVPRILVWAGDGKSVISGQRRLAAYRRLGKTHIEAEIMDISLAEAMKQANTSNEGEPLYWLDRYEGWERYLTPDSGLTDDQAAATVGKAPSWVRRARNLLAVLSPAARGLIREQLEESPSNEDAKNKGNNDIPQTLRNDAETLKKRISENPEKWVLLDEPAFQLTSLWDKRSLDDARALVEKALPVILAHEMKTPQIKALVKWVSEGGKPEEFASAPAVSKPKAPKLHSTAPTPDSEGTLAFKPSPLAGEGRVRGGEQVPPLPLAQSGVMPDLHTQVGTFIASHELGKRLHIPSQVMNRLLPHFTQLFQKVIGVFQWMGVKNKLVATLLALLLVFFVGSTLIGQAKRLVRGLWNMAFSRTAITQPAGGQPQVAQPKAKVETSSAAKEPAVQKQAPSPAVSGVARPARPPKFQRRGEGSVQQSQNLAAWVVSDAPLAGEFANRFYGVSYLDWDNTMDYFKARMVEDASQAFIQQYFPATLLRQVQEKRLVNTFDASKPPQLVKVEGTKDEFLAQGVVTTESRLNRNPQTLSKKPVALMVEIWHVQGFGARVGKAAEVTPEQAQALIQNAPSLSMGNPKEPGQKDATDTVGKFIVNTATNAATNVANDAVSQGIKKLLPF